LIGGTLGQPRVPFYFVVIVFLLPQVKLVVIDLFPKIFELLECFYQLGMCSGTILDELQIFIHWEKISEALTARTQKQKQQGFTKKLN